jgi:hypothetical protein
MEGRHFVRPKHMMKRFFALLVMTAMVAAPIAAHAGRGDVTQFENIDMIEPNGSKVRELEVRVVFDADAVRVLSRSNGSVLKEWKYDEIKSAEYSYTKNPRWKTGLGLGAAGVLFPPLWFIAIPLGFTKHRRHWVTIRTADDFAVLKVGKSVRKIFIPAFETKTAVNVQALGDDK